ncbi:divalent-cation tolerance protein CutA [Tsuneonella flava]|uniref:Divalent-cation tolerance protein CutA n=1 Tax=Tsuneonella flava TaxID=2055955 RepID=A0ABX7KA29_9SPHN|nr:divalent cation tolerance protein CutA [Tsuneonella flava]QSB45110.1 divalent-cation tolerance protein CutA [Tsuneonella flava]
MTALAWCPFPDRASAEAAASELLDEKLIGCANLIGPIHSIFEWNGERGNAEEWGLLAKTDATQLQATVSRIASIHPYTSPAVMGWRCDAAGGATADWLAALGGAKPTA